MHTLKHRQTEKYRVLHSERAAVIYTYTATQMLGSHTETQSQTLSDTTTSTKHTIPQSHQLQLTHIHTQAATVTKTQGHTLSHLPIACFPASTQVPHTKPSSPQTLQTDRAAPGPWGAAPWPSLNPGAWGARTGWGGGALSVRGAPPRQLGSPRDKEGGPGDLCPGTLDQVFLCVGLPEIPLILFRLWGDRVPGTETLF